MVAHREITESPVGLDRLQRSRHEIEVFGPWRTGDLGQASLEIVLTPRQHFSPNESQGPSGREQPGSEASACLQFNPVPGVECGDQLDPLGLGPVLEPPIHEAGLVPELLPGQGRHCRCRLDGGDLQTAADERAGGDAGPGSDLDRLRLWFQLGQLHDVVEELLRVTRSVAVVGAGHCVKRLRSLFRYPPQLRHDGSFP